MAFVGCDGIVIQDGRLLLQQREDFHTWGQPGGGLEPGEYLLDGVQREVREETGIETEPEALLAVHYRRWLGRDVLVFSFRCRPVGGRLRTSQETMDVRYFPLDALPEPMSPLQQERLWHVLNGDGRFRYYTQWASRRLQLTQGAKLIWRTVRNKIQRRPPWHPKEFTIGAFATLWNETGRVLLLHRTDMDAWNLPGGRVEAGEAPWEACVREVQEETGLSVRVECLTGVYAKPHKDELVFNLDCSITGGRLRPSDEADAAHYFALDALPDTLLARQRERIMDAAAGDQWPIVRQQGSKTDHSLQLVPT